MGGQTIQAAWAVGWLNEFTLHQVPVLLGGGTSFFGSLPKSVELELISLVDAPGVTHLTYRVVR